MKDYTLNKKEKNNFILNYEIKNNKIIICYASGQQYETLYTKDLEIYILNKMKEQIQSVNINKLKKKIYLKNLIEVILIELLMLLINCPYPEFILALVSEGIFDIIMCCICAINVTNRHNIIGDYKKNKCFIENMELFQDGINEEMETNINLSKTTKNNINEVIDTKIINRENDKTPQILKEPTINTIDKISTNSFNEIYNLLLKNKEFSKYYEDTSSIKKRVRTKNELNQKR